ncbi:unnamed protein product [Clonostachys byssicola]|uniref:Nephrocystin 3-like N-terminal domain-containing protein n=1 Tax=Clonostachys byssicola TaxID=160290 RepID=A0A9N9Y7P6_9HYPO|nr:unnamed protein product [Clonostachys byssicola]
MEIAVKLLMTVVTIVITAWVLTGRLRQTPKKQPQSETWTLRVDDIPTNEAGDFHSNLQTIIDRDQKLKDAVPALFRCNSITPRDDRSSCATVSITSSLSAEELCTLLERAPSKHCYTFSCTFDGITPLYEDPSRVDIDIIVIPGLGCNAIGSWRNSKTNKIWIRDFLPQDLPNIRVLLYGYDTTLPGSHSKQSIADLGNSLMETVTAFRSKTQTLRRPIIFIGHSLGGLLIKEALLLSRRKFGETKTTISRATFGILFFGVPNHGLRNEQLRTLVDGQPNKAFINDLLVDDDSEASGFLKRLSAQFAESFQGYYHIITFYERLLSPTLERDQTGGWSRTGRRCLMVTEQSAASTGIVATAGEDKIPINADHSGLVKFGSRNDVGYLVVQERLRELVEETKQKVSQRFAESDLYSPSSETHQACLRSLAYEAMDSRLDTINEESDGTCEWLASHQNFVKWREQHRGLLWIKGKPGSGKSTITKYALKRLSKVYGPETQVFSFFFHARGHELQKSLIGFFRSILHQILQRFPGSLNDLVDTFNTKRMSISEPGKNWHWNLQPLQEFLRLGLPKILTRFPVVFFIDALDECGQRPALDLIEYFQRILQCLPPKGRQFGICFSCRHYPIMPGNGGLEVVLEKENQRDICLFVKSRLLMNNDLIGNDKANDELFGLIVWRARGVFLWAMLVVREISRMAIEGESMAAMKAEITRMPCDLNTFYEDLVKNSKNHSAMLNLIQWICLSETPLMKSELQWALVVDPKSPPKSVEEYLASENFISDDRFEKRIKTLSCGLVEIQAFYIQFIHHSVKEFFLGQGLALLAQRETKEAVAAAHSRMSLVCVQYMNICCNDRVVRRPLPPPLRTYAARNWSFHAILGQDARDFPKEFLDAIQWPDEGPLQNILVLLRSSVFRNFPLDTRLMHLVARFDLHKLCLFLASPPLLGDAVSHPSEKSNCHCSSLLHNAEDGHGTAVQSLPIKKAYFDLKDRNGRTPLSWAAEYGSLEVAKLLLKTGQVDIESRDEIGQTPLSRAAKYGSLEVARLLLDTGRAEADSRDDTGRTPLSWAVENGQLEAARLLLDTGRVEPDSRDDTGRSPLSHARGRSPEVAQLLINTGKVDVDSRDSTGRTPLSWVAKHRFPEIARLLLDTGRVDPDSRDYTGRSPLSHVEGRSPEVAQLLIRTGRVDVDSRDDTGRTPLSWGVQRLSVYDEEVPKLLLDTGNVEVDSRDDAGRTPLSWAASSAADGSAELLLDTGRAEADSRDNAGRTPLSWASSLSSLGARLVRTLLDTGRVEVDSRDGTGRTPLSWAAETFHLQGKFTNGEWVPTSWTIAPSRNTVQMLLDTGRADVNSRDDTGRTPLSWAAGSPKSLFTVSMLLNTGRVDVNSRDDNGRTPLWWAARHGSWLVVEKLFNSGQVKIGSELQSCVPVAVRFSKARREELLKVLSAESKGESSGHE